MSRGWKDTILQQQSELQKLEAMDADMNDANADIEKFLKRPKPSSVAGVQKLPARQRLEASNRRKSEADAHLSSVPPPLQVQSEFNDESQGSIAYEAMEPYLSTHDGGSSPRPSSSGNAGTPKAPETTIRYQRARLNILQKQLDDGAAMRKQLVEQVHDLQKQLKAEREDSKNLKKRISSLEIELKRTSTRRTSETATSSAPSAEALHQEILAVKKDASATEKLAKQLDSQVKSKDLQLKRAAETIAKFQSQLNDIQATSQNGNKVDGSRLEEAEARIEVLEKQRTEILAAFKKQAKLVDVLKRQKVHVEAARLLSFTEEEFMKTLDWTA